ncbi:hypothetical protein O9H85_26265 [Paenibacillus filicis]|uniref:ChrB N-terminal domain-containing protein n=1 Tax=Paenibacillus gyeongsangnamensis TaxID=3388067 RepID=A0ABT4QG63_9BACL|nr:Chromate resistance protein ChrB [Paenibacillus filicis]MCZ8515851.1 hypothetical protein [Paenibacillus filicis]
MKWIVFIYKVPSQPTKFRAYLWREIKKLGCLYLQDGVCIIPDSDDTHLFIGALAEKAQQWGGQVFTFLSSTFSKEKDQELISQFNDARNEEYKELIPWVTRIHGYVEEKEQWEFSEEQLRKIKDEFQKLLRQFQSIEAKDYFEAEMGHKLRVMIDQCRKGLMKLF